MSASTAALQLGLLGTVVEVATEENSTLVLPFPVELLRFLERPAQPHTRTAPSADTDTAPAPPHHGSEAPIDHVDHDRMPTDDPPLPTQRSEPNHG